MHRHPAFHRYMRRLLASVGAVLLVIVVAACTPSAGGGGGGSKSGKADANQAKPTQLRMLYATAEANAAAVQSILPQFKQKFGFDLQVDTQPYEALQQKVFSELASQSPYYDIIIVDTPWAPALTKSIEPLSSFLNDSALNDQAKTDLGDFIPKVFYDTAVYKADKPAEHFPDATATPDVATITGKGFDVYGLPIQANALTMAYRKDLFDNAKEKAAFQQKYGKPLAVPTTWDQFTKVAQFFTRPSEKLYGTTLMAGVGDWATDDFKTLLAGYGGNGHLIGDNQTLDFNSDAGVQALTYYRDLINRYKVTPPGTTSASWDEAASMFDTGLTAMSFNYHELKLDDKVNGQIGYAVVPKGTAQGPHFGTWMLSVNKFGANKAWAYRAITWLTAAEQQVTMVKNKQLHPSRVSVYQEISDDPQIQKEFGNFYPVLGDSLAVGVGRARLTDYTEVSHAIAVAVNEAASGKTEPKAALESATGEVKRLLQQAGYHVPS
jgi:multiple sugar transport system substrate-binding protein